MSTEQPNNEMNTARARGDRRGPGGEPVMVRRRIAVVIAIVTLVVGGLLGYLAGGGPDAPTQLQVVTDLPTITVTVPATKP